MVPELAKLLPYSALSATTLPNPSSTPACGLLTNLLCHMQELCFPLLFFAKLVFAVILHYMVILFGISLLIDSFVCWFFACSWRPIWSYWLISLTRTNLVFSSVPCLGFHCEVLHMHVRSSSILPQFQLYFYLGPNTTIHSQKCLLFVNRAVEP